MVGNVQLGGFELGKIYQVSTIVIMAITVSSFLALTLWPTSAVTELRQLMITSTDSFSEMVCGLLVQEGGCRLIIGLVDYNHPQLPERL